MRSHRVALTLPLLVAVLTVALAPFCAPPVACSLSPSETSSAMRSTGCCPLNMSCCPPLRSNTLAPAAPDPTVPAPLERMDLAPFEHVSSFRLDVAVVPLAVARAPGLLSVLRI